MADEQKTIQVVATGKNFGKHDDEVVGYLGHKRRRNGEMFSIQENQFSERWMERLTEKESKMVAEEEADLKADRRRKRNHAPVI